MKPEPGFRQGRLTGRPQPVALFGNRAAAGLACRSSCGNVGYVWQREDNGAVGTVDRGPVLTSRVSAAEAAPAIIAERLACRILRCAPHLLWAAQQRPILAS